MLLYTGSDESGKPLEISPKLNKLGLKEKWIFEYHLDTLIKNKLYDIVIVTVKGDPLEIELAKKKVSKYLSKLSLPQEICAKLNLVLYTLKEEEDSTVRVMKLIAESLTKDLIIFHGQYLIDLDLKDAIALHKINSAEMTLVLKKQSELDERAKKSTNQEQFNIYGLGKESNEVYAMFNSFEAGDSNGLSIHTSVLKRCPSTRIILRSDVSDTGVYIIRNLFKNSLPKIEMIDFDLVRLMVNNQYKSKLRDVIGWIEPDKDTEEIDDLLNDELKLNKKVTIMAWIKEEDEIALDMNIVNNQNDSDEEDMTEGDQNKEMMMTDSD